MIKKFNTSISYVCLYCSSITVKDLNIFSLSSETPNVYTCDDETGCHAVCVSIQPKKNTYEITISCPVCEDTHSFNINKVRFWQNKKPIILRCPESGIGILFIGEHDEIYSLVELQETSIMQEYEGYSIPEDLDIVFRTVEEINNMSKKNLVYCSCGSRSISIGIDVDSVILSCRDCGNAKLIPTTEDELKKLSNTSAIVLD